MNFYNSNFFLIILCFISQLGTYILQFWVYIPEVRIVRKKVQIVRKKSHDNQKQKLNCKM